MRKEGIQKENGFTGIANELLDSLITSDLSHRELKLVLAIIRRTWGWKKKEDIISLSQFQEMTGIDFSNVSKSLKSLVERGYISRVDAGRSNKWGKTVYKYGIIKNRYGQNNQTILVKTTNMILVAATNTKERNKILNKGRTRLVDKMGVKPIYKLRKHI